MLFTEESTKNVDDKYKAWSVDLINEDFSPRRSALVNILLNTEHDFNVASAIRAGCFFNIRKNIIVGKRRVDMRGAVGSQNYCIIEKEPELRPVVDKLRSEGYTIAGAELDDRAVSVYDYAFPEKVAIIYGQESRGLSEEEMALCDDIILFDRRGPVRSLNVASTCTAITSFYHARHR